MNIPKPIDNLFLTWNLVCQYEAEISEETGAAYRLMKVFLLFRRLHIVN